MSDILAAIGVLLVFLTLLLAGMQKDAEEILQREAPLADQTENYANYRRSLRWQTFKVIVISLIFLLIFWTLLPHSVRIINQSRLSLWDFDELSTVFVLIEAGILGMFIFGLVYTIRLIACLNRP